MKRRSFLQGLLALPSLSALKPPEKALPVAPVPLPAPKTVQKIVLPARTIEARSFIIATCTAVSMWDAEVSGAEVTYLKPLAKAEK